MGKKVEKPSDDLLKLIELANLAPLKPTLPDSHFIIAKLYFEKTGKLYPQVQFDIHHSLDNSLLPNEQDVRTHFEAQKDALEEIRKTTKKFPRLYHYVFDETEETQCTIHGQPSRFQQLTRYDSILLIQDLLIKIAIHSTVFIEGLGLEEFTRNSFSTASEFIFPIKWRIKGGKLRFEITHITKTLEGIDARRLRFCEVCQSVFWAYRLDAKYCSEKCGNRFRVNKSIAKKEKRAQERREFLNQNFSKK